jgi:hypothetical protein
LNVQAQAAHIAVGAAVATILRLASLHVLNPEFAPSWRMVSEYAFGHYGWVLSLMFLSWGISSWALAVAIWSHKGGPAMTFVALLRAGIFEDALHGFRKLSDSQIKAQAHAAAERMLILLSSGAL